MEDVHQLDDIDHGKKARNGKENNVQEGSDFETAIIAAGFGKFNLFLLVMILACTFSQVFEANNMSYVLPIAQCDLELTLSDKGKLNSISFAGMVASGFFWGFLSDRFGRKKMMFYGYLLHWASMLIAALSQTFLVLMIAKFFGGLIVNGPTSAMLSLLIELHSSKYRSKIQLVRGLMVSSAHILLPLLSWGIFPLKALDFSIFNLLDIHSWNVFLFICSLPPIISWSLLHFIPESPKFLMSAGRNEKALKVFQRIYVMNTGKSVDTFPVKSLKMESGRCSDEPKKNFVQSIGTLKPLFHRPHIFKLCLACTNAILVMMSSNTMKFWQPQLLQAINDYKYINNGTSSNMCDMLEVVVPKNNTFVETAECYVNLDNSSVYKNSMIISGTQLIVMVLAGIVVDKIGKKLLLSTCGLIGAICSTAIYFAQDSPTLITIFAIFSSSSQTCLIVAVAVTLELFPTNFRNTALSLHMVSARSGVVIGNMLFPMLLQEGCLPPFLFIALTILGSACLAGLFSNTEGKALK